MKDPSRQRKDDHDAAQADDDGKKRSADESGRDANPEDRHERTLFFSMMSMIILGIAVVILTLALTSPPSGSFTEIYFNDHSLLPEYVKEGDYVPFRFTVNNMQEINSTYDYSIRTDMYDIDYSCERPELWLESSGAIWQSKTNDPVLYFREENYSIRFMYEIKSGNNLEVRIVDANGLAKFTVTLDYSENRILYNSSQGSAEELLDAEGGVHSFILFVSRAGLRLSIDEKTYDLPPPADISGYLQIGTKGTYAEFSDASIRHGSIDVPLYIRLSASEYIESKLMSRNGIYHADPVNLSNYTVRATFRILGAKMMLALSDDITLTYDNDTRTLLVDDSMTQKRYYVPFQRTINDLYAKVSDDSINVYYNDRYITTIPVGPGHPALNPSISYDNVSVTDFYVKSDTSPVVINYILPESKEKTVGLLTANTLKYFTKNDTTPSLFNITSGMDEEGIQNLRSYIDSERVVSGNYRLFVSYGDQARSQNFSVVFSDVDGLIYMLSVDDMAGIARFMHVDDLSSRTYSVNSSPVGIMTTNILIVDVMNSTIAAYVNDKRIFYGPVSRSTNGTFFFDYRNITIFNAKVDDGSTGKTMIIKRQSTVECAPVLKKSNVSNGSLYVESGSQKTVGADAALEGTFDIAEVTVSVDTGDSMQQIHFWVKQI